MTHLELAAGKAIFRMKLPIILLLLASLFVSVMEGGKFLVVDEPPVKSDVIIILGGDMGRVEKGAELFQAGWANQIIVSNGGAHPEHTSTKYAIAMMNQAHELGVPMDRLIPDFQATSTYENALYTREIMEKQNLSSAIVVSSTYHMRRVQYSFNKVFEDSPIKLTYSASPKPGFDPESWWTDRESFMLTVREYLKLVAYMVLY